jgi:isomaltose glucohydrolase
VISPQRSVEVILAGQSPSGAYVASPSFEHYRYCWLRDGSFVADAMREAGHEASANRFFDWVARLEEPWDARYRLDGSRDDSDWPKLQLDGPGLYLGALRRAGRWNETADRIARWLGERWGEPCIDWWEEREGVHAATLWAVGNGLRSDEIKQEALRRSADRLDASLLFIGTPEIVERVEAQLVSPGGGVWRNLDDEYYGGGEWPLLTAMLGLAYADQGRFDDAGRCLDWVEAHATRGGELPEQVHENLLRPDRYEPWVERWGEPACPLLWSHAMHLRLCHAVGRG